MGKGKKKKDKRSATPAEAGWTHDVDDPNPSIADSPEYQRWIRFNYESHRAARLHFRQLGVAEESVFGDYTSKAVIDELSQLVTAATSDRIVGIDLTAKCPTTSSGELTPWIATLMRAKMAAHTNPNVLFFVMRTEENNTAYLHSLVYGPQGDPDHASLPPPTGNINNGVAFFRNKEITIPPRLAPTTAHIVADAIATLLAIGHHGFRCQLCNVSFAVWGNHEGRHVQCVDRMVITDCDHCFHPRCLIDRLHKGGPDADMCPICGEQLPMTTSDREFPAATTGAYMGAGTEPVEGRIERAEEGARRDTMHARKMSSLRATYNSSACSGLTGVSTDLRPIRNA